MLSFCHNSRCDRRTDRHLRDRKDRPAYCSAVKTGVNTKQIAVIVLRKLLFSVTIFAVVIVVIVFAVVLYLAEFPLILPTSDRLQLAHRPTSVIRLPTPHVNYCRQPVSGGSRREAVPRFTPLTVFFFSLQHKASQGTQCQPVSKRVASVGL